MSATAATRLGGLSTLQRERADRAADGAVDVWDAAAGLESVGLSERVAQASGAGSVFDVAEQLVSEARPGTAGRARRGAVESFWAAVLRSVLLVAVVVICLSTMPANAGEVLVFAIGALGWLAGQVVSAATWFAWGRGSRADGVRAGLTVAGPVLTAGLALAIALGQPALLVWIGWGVSIPLLLVLRPGLVLTLPITAAAGVCVACWASTQGRIPPFPQAASIGVGVAAGCTVLGVAAAASLGILELVRHQSRWSWATPGAVLVALTQTLAQLAMLVVLLDVVGTAGFGAVAVAGLAASVVVDPLFVLARRWTARVLHRSSSWWRGRTAIAAAGAVVCALILVASAGAASYLMSDPYKIFLNDTDVAAASVLAGAVMAATNALLRTGTSVGALAVAVLGAAAALAAANGPADGVLGYSPLVVTAAVSGLVSCLLWAGGSPIRGPGDRGGHQV